MIRRRTVARAVEVRGVGLFTGAPATLRIEPWTEPPWHAGRGPARERNLVFRLGSHDVSATIARLAASPGVPPRQTTLAMGHARVATVEHVLSALVGLGITDVAMSLDGPEVPIGDGSARPFVEAVGEAGTAELEGTLEPLTLAGPIEVRRGEAWIVARPRAEAGCGYRYDLSYESPPAPESLRSQSASFDSARGDYAREVAPARTFCLEHEARAMRAAGLFAHVSAREMLVLGPAGPIEGALRMADEPARHKLLDLIGDLALAGRPLQADIHACRAGHALNHAMARALAEAGERR